MKYEFNTSGLTYRESESSERRCAPEGAIAGRIGEFRGIGEGRALPARPVSDRKKFRYPYKMAMLLRWLRRT